ncbi:Spy/CpxP family protein refolding chaperone [Algoriphagus chordae]|uniref:TonB-dependent SusC/RagA subfamily outer membrane receptor n=1 Tax=Algoriphagus chordae TaxID=237019 RepID=A0A2W7SPR0_9BACT|nr:Spy/CpxP family protein refolding chaperone [Algoriphagus chordae]PZX52672.1 TonB-dependent SusC/RagA subfamily outer membrane receptor [Algoriphagus chordae]
MKKILFLYLLLFAGLANAQDIFQKNLYSADRVMEMRNELELTDKQAINIKNIHSANAGKFSTMKWDLDDETAKLKALLDESKIDEAAVQKQMDKVLALENSLKKQQLSTMVSIKNELSPEQQGILQNPRVQTLNGVSVTGYGVNSVSPSKIVTGYPLIRTGVPIKTGTTSLSSSTPKIVVQSTASNQKNAPLYILNTKDGMQEVKTLDFIKPDDIESIEVLKDKSAIDLFGEKGKNGVIIIKLKEDSKK